MSAGGVAVGTDRLSYLTSEELFSPPLAMGRDRL